MKVAVVVISLAVVLAALPSAAQDFSSQTAKDFTRYCTSCHEKSATDVVKDAAWWNAILEKMSMRYYGHFGGHIPVAEKTAIGKYLQAKSIFLGMCGKCHGVDRPLAATKDMEGWKASVARMSVNHEKKFGAPIPAADQAAIVDYLLAQTAK